MHLLHAHNPIFCILIHIQTSARRLTFRYPVATFFLVAQRWCTISSAFFMVSTASTFCLLWCTREGPDSPRYHGRLVMNSGLWGLIILPEVGSTQQLSFLLVVTS